MENQEKIIQVITEYLERNTLITSVSGEKPFECRYELAAEQIAAAIAPHMEPGAGWEDAPSWAEWRTVDKNRQVTFWEKQPHAHLLSKYWCDDAGGNRKYCEVDGWQYKIQQRPK